MQFDFDLLWGAYSDLSSLKEIIFGHLDLMAEKNKQSTILFEEALLSYED